ncbi:hypothetical protein Egran_04024, partial [Elaphomyces granulatus]
HHHHHHGHHKQQQSISTSSDAPPSPTLTNPEMILPLDDDERESSTPSPPFGLPPRSDMQVLHGDRSFPEDSQTNFNGSNNMDTLNVSVGVAVSIPDRPPRGKWGYESYAHGRPLSDIGEEDSQLSPPSSGGSDQIAVKNGDFASSPTRHGYREEYDSCTSRSSSTISARSGQGRLKTTTDSQNGDEAHFDPDDAEDRVIQEYLGERVETSNGNGVGSVRSESSTPSIEGDEGSFDEDDGSSTILSTEAERILENAKKRLTLMEGNLTRARSSLRISPSPSPSPSPVSSFSPIRTHQPAGELYRSISRSDRKGSVLRSRQMYGVTHDKGTNHHSRVHSETNLPSALQSSISSDSVHPSRSLSALGSTSAYSFGADDNSFPYSSSRAYLTHRPSSALHISTQIINHPNLKEDDERSPASEDISANTPQGLGISTSNQTPKVTTMEEFNSAYPSHRPPSRAQSQLQVRNLQEQVEGLKSKISNLKVKTQEDNLRRRSLQSLRTPSPFSAAEQWYTTALEYRDGSNGLNANAGYGWSPQHDQTVFPHHRDESGEAQADTQSSEKDPQPEAGEQVNEDDGISILESHYEDAEEGDLDGSVRSPDSDIDRAALNAILNEPLEDDEIYKDFPEASTASDATPHEEREDAFDYENFFLHSALGNYSRSKMHRLSYISTTSVETALAIPPQSSPRVKHSRTNSADSMSTAATFATAVEGSYDSDNESTAETEVDHLLNPRLEYRSSVRSEQSNLQNDDEARVNHIRHSTASFINDSRLFTSPIPSLGDRAGSATPTSAFVSSLLSSVATSPNPTSATEEPSVLNNDDTRLLEQLFQSLGNVCMELQKITASPEIESDLKAMRVLRRRLDSAKRVLDGQLDV